MNRDNFPNPELNQSISDIELSNILSKIIELSPQSKLLPALVKIFVDNSNEPLSYLEIGYLLKTIGVMGNNLDDELGNLDKAKLAINSRLKKAGLKFKLVITEDTKGKQRVVAGNNKRRFRGPGHGKHHKELKFHRT